MYCEKRSKLTLLALLCLFFSNVTASEVRYAFESKSEVRENLPEGLSEMMDVQVNKYVKKYIGSYLVRGRVSTQRILGNATIYFPIYEEYLAENNLPDELKYLSVIESRLNPNAISPTGAVGLWQFMKPTARQYGLKIDDYVDERKDVYRSTEAALKYLKKLHHQFGDWSLAIAAYNCGPGRVRQSIRKAGTKDLDKVSKYLPKETLRYLDRFVAANYAFKNYHFYNLRPSYPDYTLQFTQVQKIHKRYSFAKLAQLTGIDKAVIAQLNPSYHKGIIPPNYGGYNLVLPTIGVNEGWEL